MTTFGPKTHMCKKIIKQITNGHFSRQIYKTLSSNADTSGCCPPTKPVLMTPECKVAVITGGAEGIGYAMATTFLKAGMGSVAITGLNTAKGKDAVNCLNNTFGKNRAMFINSNCNCMVQLEETFKVVHEAYDKIDVVVNAAGVCDGANWEKEIVTNLIGTVRGTLLGYQYVGKEGSGKGGLIINVSGTSGLLPMPPTPTLAATHHAIIGLSRSFGDASHVNRSGVRVVTLCPGITSTAFFKNAQGMTPTLGSETETFLKNAKKQKPEVCGCAALHLMKYGESGSIWVCEGSRLFLVNLPHWETISTLEAQYM